MPPKAVRGASTGRGRGRGRGKATSGSSVPGILPVQTTDDHDISGGHSAQTSATLGGSRPNITTPQHLLDDDADPSPNSSPATIPTETPATTPARANIPRSDPSGSNVPQPSSSSIRGGRGGARGGAATKPATTSRFKPKNVRRDASELEEIARKENDRLAAIAAENAREASAKMRGRGRPLRGRGDAMGRGMGRKTTATGTFGVAPEALKSTPGGVLSFKREGGAGGGNSRGPGGASGGFNVKREGGGGSYSGSGLPGTQDRDWFPEPQYPHDDDDVAKIDIEAINLISDEDDEPQYSGSRSKSNVYGKGSSKKGLRPVRLHREEHKERVLLVNTESSTKSPPDEDGNLPTNDDLQPSKNAKEFKGVYQDPDDVQIKDEPRATPEPPELTVKASPDSKRKIQDAHASTVPINLDPVLDEETFTSPREKRKVRRPSKNKEKKPVIQTEEDRAEYMRHLDDIEILAKELGGMQGNINKGKAKDTEGDTAMDNTTAEDEEQKHGNGRLYLFQFPPVLPELYNPAKDLKPRNPMLVRREEEDAAAKAKEELELLGSMSTTGSNSKGKLSSRPDLTGEPAPTAPVAIKKEEEGVETAAEKARREEEERKKKNKKADVVHEEGWVGKLIVRESGRVELTWGGTTLLVGRGAEASFLTTGVIVDSVERGPPGGGVAEGKAMGMGQIMGKFVVTPDWENY